MSAGNTPSVPLNSLASVWGGPLVSTFLASVLYGITVLQTFYYYNRYGSSDRSLWLIIVGVIFVLDSAALALFMFCVYYYLVMSWGMPNMLAPDVKEFPSEYAISAVLVFIVQNFYINTIRALHAPLIITITLIAASLTALVTSLILPAVQLNLKLIQTIVDAPLNHLAFNIARGTALGCDLGIVAALCWLLGLRRTNIRRADNMINVLIVFTVQRGILQAVVQAGEVISYAVKPSSIYFLPFHVIVSRIYCTSFLATLNSREYVAKKGMLTYEKEDKRGGVRREPLSNISFATPQVRETNQTQERGQSASGGRFASVFGASGPILTSLLEPPFLSTTSGGRSGAKSSYSRPSRTQMDGVHYPSSGTALTPSSQYPQSLSIPGSGYTRSSNYPETLSASTGDAPYPPPGITTDSGSDGDIEKGMSDLEEHEQDNSE